MKRIYLLFLAIVLFSINGISQALLQESFEGTFPPAGWTIINNGTGNTWTQNTTATYAYNGTKSMQLMYNTTNAADAWAITPALNLNTNPVTITLWTRVRRATSLESLKITVGTGNTVADQTTVLSDNPSLSNTAFQQITATFTAPTAGTYYFGFNCYSAANKRYLYLDSITISQLLPACTGTPVGGTTISSVTTICPNLPFNLSVTNSSGGVSGLSYQWQSSPDSINWTDIAGEVNPTTTVTAGITTATYYRRKVSCSGTDSYSTMVQVSLNPPSFCVCSPNNGTTLHSATTPSIDEVDIPGTNLTNSSPGAPTNGYTLFSDTSMVPSLSAGVTYTLNTTFSAASIASVWFDWNQDGVLDATEWTQITTNATTGSISFTVDPAALLGNTLMRVRSRLPGNANAATDACTTFGSGETEDYIINIVKGTSCNGSPIGGIITYADTSICPNSGFTLAVTGASTGTTGLTFQWQSSADTTSWADISGETNSTYSSTGITTPTYFRRKISCSGNDAFSSYLYLKINPAMICACSPNTGTTLHSATTPSIDEVDIPGTKLTNSSTGAPTNGYNIFTDTTIVPNLSVGATYTLNTTFSAASIASVWFDWNQDGVFDASEWTQITTNAATGSITFTVDPAALLGNTLMRIRSRLPGNANASTDACTTFGSGETEDYVINVVAPLPVSMIQFKGIKQDNKNLLTWITTNEKNNKGFEVQHSFNGIEFNKIGYIETAAQNGNSTNNLTYHFTDNSFTDGANYYRLKQIDINGKSSISNTVLIKGNSANKFIITCIFPNPAIEKLTVIVSSPITQYSTVLITDMSSRIIKEEKILANEGNNQYQINVSGLLSGTYIIKVYSNNAYESAIQKFIKR